MADATTEPFAGTMTWPKPARDFTTGAEILRNKPAIAYSRCCAIQRSSTVASDLKTEPGKAVPHFRNRHEKVPQQAGAMVFDHQDDWRLYRRQQRSPRFNRMKG